MAGVKEWDIGSRGHKTGCCKKGMAEVKQEDISK